jgi:enoyl-CoA hydratase/carnithine racemase
LSDQLVTSELADGILTITLRRADKRNALNPELFAAVGDAFTAADRDEVRVVLLEGEGPVFCAGIDVGSLVALGNNGNGQDLESGGGERLQEIYMTLERIGKPSVCAVHGAAVGAGFQLALACDLRVAAKGVRLGMFEIHYGIIPDLTGIHRVVQLAGPARAKDLVLTGRELGAEEALAMGLVDRVVEPSELATAARALAAEIASKSPRATSAGKRLVDAAAAGQSPDDNLKDVLAAQLKLMRGADFTEAVSARLQKRPAVFSGS